MLNYIVSKALLGVKLASLLDIIKSEVSLLTNVKTTTSLNNIKLAKVTFNLPAPSKLNIFLITYLLNKYISALEI